VLAVSSEVLTLPGRWSRGRQARWALCRYWQRGRVFTCCFLRLRRSLYPRASTHIPSTLSPG